MKGPAEIAEANRKLLEKMREDAKAEIILQIEQAIARGTKGKQELTQLACDVLQRIVLRECGRALHIVAGETVEEAEEKLERSDAIRTELSGSFSHYFQKEIPYLIALKLATDPQHRITVASRQHLDAVIQQVETLKAEGIEKVSDLIMALDATTSLLNKKITRDQYRTVAGCMCGAPSGGLTLLGLLMLALCVTCAAVGAGWVAIASTGLLSVGLFAVNAPTSLSGAMYALVAQEQQEIDQAASSRPVPEA